MAGVAVLGYGVVGSGVVDVIEKHRKMISARAGQDIRVKYILDIRDFPDSPYRDKFVKDFSLIESDPEVTTVVETIGGTRAAYEFTKRALLAGKNVVTSNKELVAAKAVEFFKLAADKNVNYLFEASVGGGIPVIRPINQCLAANEITEIYGILNGTTNYILTRMIKAGLSFDDALKEAQALGYAEANPAADIDGEDACRKICILSSLAFGFHVYPDMVRIEGIKHIAPEDIAFGDAMKMKIKLLGRSQKISDGVIYVSVAPYLVPDTSPLATIDGVFNGIIVRGDSVGEVMFYGQGAGKYPTASAVVADVIDAAKHARARKWMDWEEGSPEHISNCRLVRHDYMIRVRDDNLSRVFQKSGDIFGEITPIDCPNTSIFDGAFTVKDMPEGVLLEKIGELDNAFEAPVVQNKLMLL